MASRTKFDRFFKFVAIVFCVGWLFKEILLPASVAALYSNQFMKQVVACDTAMESAWYGPSDNEFEKKSQDIHLLDCHEYDKTRKVLLMSGLPEEYLSWLGLLALEIYQRSASEMAEQHRFRER
ncbi:TIGR03982 family His-Xaa-Ser system protein [Litorivicinus sp.]|nr:TIGR03982 family His-Xaa-Ser system protein [Litorivicinus sp.]